MILDLNLLCRLGTPADPVLNLVSHIPLNEDKHVLLQFSGTLLLIMLIYVL